MSIYSNVLLTSPGEVKNLTMVNMNVSDEYVGYAIRDTQFIDLQSIIGTRLLNKIQLLVYNELENLENKITDEANIAYNDLLEDFIKPFLVHKSAVNTLIPISYKTRNMGVIKTSDTNIQNAELGDIAYLVNYYNEQTSFYETRLSKFLCSNKEAFSELSEKVESWEQEALLGKNFAPVDLWLGSLNEKTCDC